MRDNQCAIIKTMSFPSSLNPSSDPSPTPANLAIPAPLLPTVAVAGSSLRFPVRRIYCVGRNYLAHVREMGNDEKLPPLYFAKAPDMIVESGATIPYPLLTKNLQHEVELVVAMKSGGENIPVERALDHVYGYAVGFDM